LEDFWARYFQPSGESGPVYWSYFAERLATLATIPEGAAVLDIGTYDGNVLFKAMKHAGVCGYGIGIDIYGSGLHDGIVEATGCGLGNVDFAQMDAAHLGFLPEIFDSILANFVGWDYCYDFNRLEFIAPEIRMAEIVRLLKPGGQLGIGFWIEQCDLDWIVKAFKKYLPKRYETTCKWITSYGKENPTGYGVILRTSGFHDIWFHVETTRFVSPNTATWWMQMKQAAREYFEKIPEVEQFKEQIFADLNQFQSSDGIHFDKTVGYAFGTKF
jgi:SAM-dependent methyltransferase